MYTVTLRPSAARELRKLTIASRRIIAGVIDELGANPRPHGSKKLVGSELWRVRVGDYRIVYRLEDRELVVEVIRIAHRRDVYR